MADFHLQERRSAPKIYQLMIATVAVLLMPYTIQAVDELPREAVLPVDMPVRQSRHPWMLASRMGIG